MLSQVYVYQDKKKILHFVWESADIMEMSENEEMIFVGTFEAEVVQDEQLLIDL